MKRSLQNTTSLLLLGILLPAALLALLSCERQDPIDGHDQVFLQLRSAVNNGNAENRVKEIRILAFKQGAGTAVYNDMLEFPGDDLSQPSELIGLDPATYDLLFVANESDYNGLTAAL